MTGLPEVKEKDTNGHIFSSIYSSTTPRYAHIEHLQILSININSSVRHYKCSKTLFTTRYSMSSSADRVRDIISRSTYKPSTTSNKEDVRNTQNIVSMVLVVVLALFFGVLAIIYLGLGGKTEDREPFTSLSTGRYKEI